MSEIQANKLSPSSGTAVQLGDSGDTFTIPSGATFTNNGTATGFGFTPYGASAYSNAAQSIPTGTNTKVLLVTVTFPFQVNNMFTKPFPVSFLSSPPLFLFLSYREALKKEMLIYSQNKNSSLKI